MPEGRPNRFGIAAVVAGVPLPTIAASLGHANLQTTTGYTTAAVLEARNFFARMWVQEANSARSGVRRPPERARNSHGAYVARKLGPSCELHALRDSSNGGFEEISQDHGLKFMPGIAAD